MALQSLALSGDDGDVNRGVLKATVAIERSLASDLWVDDLHLTASGRRVFEEEGYAARELGKIKHESENLVSQLDEVARVLVSVDQALAQTALDESTQAGGSAEELARIQDDLTRGDELAKRGRFEEAIESYEDAWAHAQKSVQ